MAARAAGGRRRRRALPAAAAALAACLYASSEPGRSAAFVALGEGSGGSQPRRAALAGPLAAAAATWLTPLGGGAWRAAAFENALPEAARYKNRNPGAKPEDLGVKVRKLNRFEKSDGPVVKECGYGPNCFSTTADPDDPNLTSRLNPWAIPKGTTPADAFAQLEQAVRSYPPGQNGVDGGGFVVKQASASDGYLYAQFESLKKGKVDDVEFSIGSDGSVQVRSGSRFGMKADFGSNAKRLNYVAAQLEGQGWSAPQITKDTHPYYFSMNSGKTKTQCVGIDCPVNYELIAEEPGEPKDPAD